MPDGLAASLPPGSWERHMLIAAEVVDSVTLERVRDKVVVAATGLNGKPVVNGSGFYVWLQEGSARPLRITVDGSQSGYADADVAAPVPPGNSVRIELFPTAAYRFPQGATALRGTLLQSRFGAPNAIPGATILLQWLGDNGWVDAPTAVATNDAGDFAAPLRLGPKDKPNISAGQFSARLRITRSNVARTSDEFALPRATVTSAASPFIWEDLHP